MTTIKLDIQFDPDFLDSQNLTQEQLDSIVTSVRGLIESGKVASTGVYDLTGELVSTDIAEYQHSELHENSQSRLH